MDIMYRPVLAVAVLAAITLPVRGQSAQLLPAPPPPAQMARPFPDSAQALDLNELIREVLAENPSRRAARLNTQALGLRAEHSRALPHLSVALSLQPVPVVTARGAQRVQIRAEQSIPYPGTLRRRAEAADLAVRSSRAGEQELVLDLVHQVTVAYDMLWLAQEQEALMRAFDGELAGFERVATARYEVGQGAQAGVFRIQLERSSLALRVEEVEENRRRVRAALARLLNRSDQGGLAGPIPPRWPVAFGGAEVDPAHIGTAGVRPQGTTAPEEVQWDPGARNPAERPALEAARVRISEAETRRELARLERRPDLVFSATYYELTSGTLSPAMDGRDALMIGVGIRIPIQRAPWRAREKAAEAEVHRARADQEALVGEIRTAAEGVLLRARRQEAQLLLLDDTLLPQARASLEATLSGYTTGQVGFLDLLDAYRTLFNLRLDALGVRGRLLESDAEYSRIAGLMPDAFDFGDDDD